MPLLFPITYVNQQFLEQEEMGKKRYIKGKNVVDVMICLPYLPDIVHMTEHAQQPRDALIWLHKKERNKQ